MASGCDSGGEDDVLNLGFMFFDAQKEKVSGLVCLVRKLISEKQANLFGIAKAFRGKGKISGRDWGHGLIIFSFKRAMDRDWVLRNQPWHFDNNLFAVKGL